MLTADGIRSHLDYTAWASRRLMEAASTLPADQLTRDFGTADRSVLGTLVHVYAADRTWLARLEQTAPPEWITDTAAFPFSQLQEEWPRVEQRLRQWAAALTDEAARTPIAYSDLRGRQWSQPPWMIVLHVVNHGTHHRGQVSGFLRSLGHTPPPLDLARFYREQAMHA